MNQEQFEDHIKNTFNDHQVPLDTDALWGAIETDLPAEKKRKRFFFWFFFGISGLLLIGMIAFSQFGRISDTEIAYSNTIANHISDNTTTLSNQKVISSNIVSNENSLDLVKAIQPNILSKNKQKTPNQANTKRTVTTNSSKTIYQTPSKPTSLNTSKNENLSSNQNPTEPTTVRKTAVLTKKPITKASISPRYNNLNPLSLRWSLADHSIKTKPISIPTNYSKWSVFTTIQSGINLVSKTIKTNNNGTDSYTNLMTSTETSLLSYQFGGLIGVQHQKSHWYIKTGLQYQQLNEVFDYEQSNTRILHSVTGNNQTELTTRIVQHYNQIQLLEIPLIVGKSFINRHRMSFELEAGFATSVSLRTDGRFLNQQENVADLDRSLFSQQQWSALVGTGVSYKISPKTALTFGTAYQHYFNSFTKKDAPTKEKYDVLSVRLGIKKVF